MFNRNLMLPKAGVESFFLWGARQTGKSTLLRQTYKDARLQKAAQTSRDQRTQVLFL